jgi:semaphorin 6
LKFPSILIKTCQPSSDCVALQDPYCAWDKIAGKCRSHGAPRWTEETYFYSQVSTGQHQACPSNKITPTVIESQKGYDEFDLRNKNNPGTNKGFDEGGPQITPDVMNQYTVETVVMAVLAAAIFAMLVGFITGYFCGRRCHKDEDDNLPYPDTEYEYFEQRSNINR